MGVKKLLTALQENRRTCDLREFAGCKVGIDISCWVHRFGAKCDFHASEEATIAQYCSLRVCERCIRTLERLQREDIEPVVVFDGAALPLKSEERAKREEGLELKRAKVLSDAGFDRQAQDHYSRSFSLTPALVATLMRDLEAAGIEYLVAPYESDAQLAYLTGIGYIAAAVSEDSDLLVFGCERVVFKLDHNLSGELQTLSDLFSHSAFKGWSMDHLRWFAALSGCDYIPNLDSIGPKTAYSIVSRASSLSDVYRKLSLCRKSGSLPPEYLQRFAMAQLCYAHQVVYCPVNRRTVYLRPMHRVPEELTDEQVTGAVGRLDVSPPVLSTALSEPPRDRLWDSLSRLHKPSPFLFPLN